ncbi:MAG: PH domain-containing protein [Actinomycetota bacterium]|nr:PH domain-containing protein [Actinomycetota bacterium]
MNADAVVTAQPVKSARIAMVGAVLVAAAFLVIALVLKHTTDGVSFTDPDQFGMAGTGLLIAVGILAFTRPRLRADADGVDTRGFFGGFRRVDWDLVSVVEFPPKVRFARLVLPGDELIVLYAVQRGDAERSVATMRQLRELHSQHLANH